MPYFFQKELFVNMFFIYSAGGKNTEHKVLFLLL